jgi:CheY-like chemotaxis protein
MNEALISVLLVEDNPGDARLLSEALAESLFPRFEVTRAARLADGLKRLGEARFDVVLLDLSLPDSPAGLGSLMKIHARNPRVPVVVLTGLKDERLEDWSIEEGAQIYLAKGELRPEALVGALRFAIENQRTPEQRFEKHLATLGIAQNEE